jgi:hypothetical protein
MSPLHATQAEKSPELIELEKEIKENVLNGLVFLKEKYGEDYVEHIDMDTFDIRSGSACVLGQVHPAYYPVTGTDDGYVAACNHFFPNRYGREFGFSTPAHCNDWEDEYDDDGIDAWDVLQQEWVARLEDERRSRDRKKAAGLV